MQLCVGWAMFTAMGQRRADRELAMHLDACGSPVQCCQLAYRSEFSCVLLMLVRSRMLFEISVMSSKCAPAKSTSSWFFVPNDRHQPLSKISLFFPGLIVPPWVFSPTFGLRRFGRFSVNWFSTIIVMSMNNFFCWISHASFLNPRSSYYICFHSRIILKLILHR